MQGSGDLFIVQLVFCIKKLYFFVNMGGEVSVGMRFSRPFQPCPPLSIMGKTP